MAVLGEEDRAKDRVRTRRKTVGLVLVFSVPAMAACIFLLYIVDCGDSGCDRPTRVPMPALPAELAALPARAYMLCSHDANLSRGGVYVWELPGTCAGTDSTGA